MALLVLLPLAVVLGSGFAGGCAHGTRRCPNPTRWPPAPDLFTAAIAVPFNAVFGVLLAAWAVARFEFRAKRVLLALIDLPFAVSPVVAGLCLVLISAATAGSAMAAAHDVKILFARPGIVLAATLFITFPFVARADPADAATGARTRELAARLARRRMRGPCSPGSRCPT